MNILEKKAIYGQACFALSCYEEPEEHCTTEQEAVCDMYDVLVKIVNSWDKLTTEEK